MSHYDNGIYFDFWLIIGGVLILFCGYTAVVIYSLSVLTGVIVGFYFEREFFQPIRNNHTPAAEPGPCEEEDKQ
jgi:hypothetical protein